MATLSGTDILPTNAKAEHIAFGAYDASVHGDKAHKLSAVGCNPSVRGTFPGRKAAARLFADERRLTRTNSRWSRSPEFSGWRSRKTLQTPRAGLFGSRVAVYAPPLRSTSVVCCYSLLSENPSIPNDESASAFIGNIILPKFEEEHIHRLHMLVGLFLTDIDQQGTNWAHTIKAPITFGFGVTKQAFGTTLLRPRGFTATGSPTISACSGSDQAILYTKTYTNGG